MPSSVLTIIREVPWTAWVILACQHGCCIFSLPSQWVSLQNRFFTMHLREIVENFASKACIVKKLSWRETCWQMVFMANSDFFHIIVTRKSSFKFGLFDLGWKYQGHTVPRNTDLNNTAYHKVPTQCLGKHFNITRRTHFFRSKV